MDQELAHVIDGRVPWREAELEQEPERIWRDEGTVDEVMWQSTGGCRQDQPPSALGMIQREALGDHPAE